MSQDQPEEMEIGTHQTFAHGPGSTDDIPMVDLSQDNNNQEFQQMQNHQFHNGQGISPVTTQPTGSNMRHDQFIHQTPPSSDRDVQDIYTAPGDQGSRPTQTNMMHQNFPTDRTHGSDSQRHEQNLRSSTDGQFSNDKDSFTSSAGDQDSRPLNDMNPLNLRNTTDRHRSDSQRNGSLFSSSRDGQCPNDKDMYTAHGDQGSRPTQTNMMHQNLPTDRTHGSDSQRHEQNLRSSTDGQFSSDKDSFTSSAGDQDSRPLNDMNPLNLRNTTDRHRSDSQRNESLPSASIDGRFSNDKISHASGAEGLNSRTTPRDMKKQSRTGSMDRTHSSENNCKGGDESQPSAPLDVAKFIIKVDWREPFPERWRATLQRALQSWFLKTEGTPEILSLKLMDDQSCAEVQITPATALEAIKNLKSIPLTFKNEKNEKKEVTTLIFTDETHSVTGQQNPSILDKNRFSSPQVNSDEPSGVKNSVKDVSATNSGLLVPLYQFWYLHHVYRKELEQIEKQHGVSIRAEVSVSINLTKSQSPDSVSKATDDFQKLLQGCVDSCSDAAINHNHMDSDIVKQALHHIQSDNSKMMFTMSPSDCLFFGPKNLTDLIKREVEGTRMESQFNDRSSRMNKDDNFSPQSRSSLNMDTKDLPTHLEMDKVHWDLMKLSYKEQLSQLEIKYGVSFNEEKQQKNSTIKVQARSKGVQHINLESHAIRALTQLYQKLASAAVTCELKTPKDATLVASAVEKLQQEHHCVVAEDASSGWRLFGLPEDLGPAIAEIEKRLHKKVFDDKKKKSIGYSEDVPHARGIQWNQTPDYGPGAVGGSVRDEGMNFRGWSEADKGLIDDLKENSRNDSKDAHAEEENCAICMDSFKDKKKLKCGHEFCQECIRLSVESMGSICPVCKEVFGILEGNQPDGTMRVTNSRSRLPGYPDCGTIEITYDIPSGVQTKKHPNPGKSFYGTTRQAYLPDNREGKEVLSLLQRAFNQKMIFTVGKSTTTGAENVVTWNDIHHKTGRYGGSFSYPDPDYLKRVKEELKAKGIE